MRKLTMLVVALFILISTIMLGCSGDDNSTNPTDPNDPGESGTVVLFSEDFEATDLSEWEGAPTQYLKTFSSDWTWGFSHTVGGTSTNIDEGSVEVTSTHAKSGSKSLLFKAKTGLISTFDNPGGTYDEHTCNRNYTEQVTKIIRQFSLADYVKGDQVNFSLNIKPVEITKSVDFSPVHFDINVYGANRILKDTSLNYDYLLTNLGKWNEINIDLSQYTEWVDDLIIFISFTPNAYYCFEFCYQSYYPTCNTKNYGDSSSCVIAIDDVKLEVIPIAGK